MHMPLVILDRDGTVNHDSDDYIKSPEEWVALPGAIDAIAKLNHAGWRVVIASNQSGLGRGLFDVATLNQMHDKMNKALAKAGGRVEAIFYCPHTPDENCNCRKPLTGLFDQIADRFGVDLKEVHAVGDSLRDAQAAVASGCIPHWVLTGKGEPFRGKDMPDTFPAHTRMHADVMAFADWLLAQPTLKTTAHTPSSGI
jgi:D-glycero-D-manno-heptose 1,7-bisphosphate phosphatase